MTARRDVMGGLPRRNGERLSGLWLEVTRRSFGKETPAQPKHLVTSSPRPDVVVSAVVPTTLPRPTPMVPYRRAAAVISVLRTNQSQCSSDVATLELYGCSI